MLGPDFARIARVWLGVGLRLQALGNIQSKTCSRLLSFVFVVVGGIARTSTTSGGVAGNLNQFFALALA